jgi:hypothetical protein
MTPPEIPSMRTALIPTDHEKYLATTVSVRCDTQHRVALLLAKYRVELVGLDGKQSPAIVALEEARESLNEALHKLRAP